MQGKRENTSIYETNMLPDELRPHEGLSFSISPLASSFQCIVITLRKAFPLAPLVQHVQALVNLYH